MALRGVFTILAFLVIQKGISVSSQSLNIQPQKSLCRQYHRINETRRVSFMEEYMGTNDYDYLQILTRVNFRTDTVTKWMVVEMCCEGYEPSQNADSSEHCVPVCPSGCHNGVCQHPNSCLCDPGYDASVDNITRISECLPHCSSGCVGGTCIAPETCSCNLGYDLTDDSTSCKPSCTGVDAGGPENCGDEGICVGPNACQCGDGFAPLRWVIDHKEIVNETKPIYYAKWQIDCFPVCDQGCPKEADCIAPNTCHCVAGYWPDSFDILTECRPYCMQQCHNGFCESPNRCRCDNGYKEHDSLGSNFCEPDCQDECVNGKCVQPNRCECLPGYEKLIIHSANQSEYSGNICVANCDDCDHGTCIAPNKCHCDPGYVSEEVHRFGAVCQPFCDPTCKEGSECIAPNKCSCDPGFYQEHDSTSCKPLCFRIDAGGAENCGEHGICVAPDSCQCRDGYAPLHWVTGNAQMTNRTKPIFYRKMEMDCFPYCEPQCPKNAACIAPNTCHCVDGYQPKYGNIGQLTECLPICKPPCYQGSCEHPNVCQCYNGYRANDSLSSNICEPVCQDDCVNGTCIRPNVCDCLRGYEKMRNSTENQFTLSPNICTPMCYPECGNGTCVGPFQCECNHGYVAGYPLYKPLFLNEICQPFCNPQCHDELFCVAPNHCQLLDTDSDRLQNFRARIVDFSSKECGHNGSFSKKNGTCMCNYPSSTTQCTETRLCAVIIVNNTESAEEFSLLERVIDLDKTNEILELFRSTMVCQNECRISILSKRSLESIRNDTKQCYTINLHDSKVGLMFNATENLVPISDETFNGSFICFLNTGYRCEIPNYGSRKIGTAVTAGVIAAAMFLVTIIFALVLSIYLTRRKIRTLFAAGSPQKDEAMTDRSEGTDSPFHTDDTSHL